MIVLDGSVVIKLGSGTPDELGEKFASRRDLVVAIDRQDMIVDGSLADFELESNLFFGVACDQAIEHLQSAVGERAERGLVGSSEISPDLVVDRHVDQRDDALFAWGEVARANTFVQPEGCASSGDVRWADGDDVVIDPALAVDFVVGVRAIPGVLAPDLITGENHCLSRKLGQVWIFGGALDGDGLGVLSPASFSLVGNPTGAVDANEVGFGVAGRTKVFDLGVDDDLRSDELAQSCEQIVSPSVNTGTQIAALACDLVALVDIFCGQVGEHQDSPSEPWDGSLVSSVPEIYSESQGDFRILQANERLSVGLNESIIDLNAHEQTRLNQGPTYSFVFKQSLYKHGKSGTHERLTMPIQCMLPCTQGVIGPLGDGFMEAA